MRTILSEVGIAFSNCCRVKGMHGSHVLKIICCTNRIAFSESTLSFFSLLCPLALPRVQCQHCATG